MPSRIFFTSIVLLALTLIPTLAAAQDAGASDAPQAGIVLEESVITGRLQKPEAFYFLKNAELGWEKLHHERSFIEAIELTIHQDPF